MKMRRSTFILSIILASLLFYIFVIDVPSERRKREESKFIPWPEEEVVAFELKVDSKNLNARVVRTGKDSWEITSPVNTLADDFTISLMFSSIKDATKEKVADSGDPKDYGLDKPEVVFKVENKKGEKVTFLLGKENPITAERYLMVEGDKAIYLIGSYVFKQIDQSLYSLRKKDLIPENTIAIQEFSLSYLRPAREFSFKRGEQSLWNITSPVNVPISQDKVTDVLWDVVEGKAEEIIDNPKDLKEYGLDSPQLIVKLKTEKGKEYEVLYSWSKDERTLWGMLKGGVSVYKFGKHIPKTLRVTSINDLLDKRPLRGSYYSLNFIEIEYPNGNKVSIKEEGGKWTGTENADSIARELCDIEAEKVVYNGELPPDVKPVLKVIAKDALKEVKVEYYEGIDSGWAKDLDYPIVYKLGKLLEELLPNLAKK
ncbi:MAG: DUF4340 domain-containing protein [Synergistetes bacterium]|nr:DUF4340 domain-containing protein [Synergistota bacterium]